MSGPPIARCSGRWLWLVGRTRDQGRPKKNWTRCLADDIRVFEATGGSTDSSPVLFGVEALLSPRAAKKSGDWHREIVNAADRFMTRWHRGEAEERWLRHAAEDAKSSN